MSELGYRLIALGLSMAYMLVRGVSERRLGRASKYATLKNADPRDRRELLVLSVVVIPQWLYMLTPWLDFAAMGFPDAVRWLGAVITALGVAAFAWTHATLAGNWSPVIESPPEGELITTGPYRWVRHPMYTSFFIYNAGMVLLTSNWLAGPLVFLAFVWMYFDRVGREEAMMLDTFGDKYARYAENTGRLFPRFGR